MDILELENKISKFAGEYYEGSSSISDVEFDQLVVQLRELNPESSILTTGWGYSPTTRKVDHTFQVGSLGKIREKSQLFESETYVITPKLDGGSAVAYYKERKLHKIVSRGNGYVGVDITAALRHAVPQELPDVYHSSVSYIRGEVVLSYEDADLMPDVAHPRNKAIGLSQSLNSDVDQVSKLQFIAYDADILESDKAYILEAIKSLGFKIPEYVSITKEELHLSKNKGDWSYLYKLDNHTYPTDGLVIESYQATESIAYKFTDDTMPTKVIDIQWNLSKHGKMVPVLIVDEVNLEGANINRVTANNVAWLRGNNLGIGAEIEIVRANQIIPKVVNVLKGVVPHVPTNCPVCREVLAEDTHLYCANLNCDNLHSKLVSNILLWHKVDGIGGGIVRDFLDTNDITKPVDYLKELEFNNNVSGNKLKGVVEDILKGEVTLCKLLRMTHIPSIGGTASYKLDQMISADEFVLVIESDQKIPETWNVVNYLNSIELENYRPQLKAMIELFRGRITNEVPKSKIVSKVKYCMTGTLSKPRGKLVEEFNESGLEFVGMNDCEILVTDSENMTSKMKAAIAKGVKIMTEAQFREAYVG